MRIFNHSITFQSFQNMLMSGHIARRGAVKNEHIPTVRRVEIQNKDGQPVAKSPEQLAVGEHMHRVWDCEKPNFYKMFGLDRWQHDEYVDKVADNRLEVVDRLTWHQGRSMTERCYSVIGTGPKSMQRNVGPWHVNMAGLNVMVRGRVEQEMRKRLPHNDEKLSEIIEDAQAAGTALASVHEPRRANVRR